MDFKQESGMNEREAYIALNMIERIGPAGVSKRIGELGSAVAVFDSMPGNSDVDWRGELERVEQMGARLITRIDAEYPGNLLEIYDPPLALYMLGSLKDADRHSIAVVGSRRPTHYGRETAARLSGQLAASGMTVVSGLAEGIDTAAHEGALNTGGRTLAVLGSALDRIYPSSNKGLAGRIARYGAVLSEFPLGRHPDKTTFPMRNRIVSGLSMGVLVVEAGKKSGALITVNQALEQGRSVFAVPGRVDSRMSAGPNGLIKHGARLVETVDDILHEYEFLFPDIAGFNRASCGKGAPPVKLSEEESRLVEMLSDGELHVDGLIRGSGLEPGQVSGLLIGLEMKRMVRMLPGGVVERR